MLLRVLCLTLLGIQLSWAAESVMYNVAMNKPSTYSSIANGMKASWANDGLKTDTECFVTKENEVPMFWEVHLLSPNVVSDVYLFSDNSPQQLEIVATNSNGKEVKLPFTGIASCKVGCKIKVMAEVVKLRVVKTGRSALKICEFIAEADAQSLAKETTAKAANYINPTFVSLLCFIVFSVILAKWIR